MENNTSDHVNVESDINDGNEEEKSIYDLGLDEPQEVKRGRKPGSPLIWVPVVNPNFSSAPSNPPATTYEDRRQVIDRNAVDDMSGGVRRATE
jgi:hypothetical protein